MLTISEFKKFATRDLMLMERIIVEIYTELTAGMSGFAMFDGGAHKGYHTERMQALPGCRRVYAVEADPFMMAALRDQMAQQPGAEIRLVEKALQDDPATLNIPWKSSHSHVGRSSIRSRNPAQETIWPDSENVEYREAMQVEATTIDRIIAAETAALPFIKLDLEGADLLALRGARETLRRKRPIVAFENAINAPETHGFTLEQMARYFDDLDYLPMNFIGERLTPLTWFGFFEAWLVPREQASWLSRKLWEKAAEHTGVPSRREYPVANPAANDAQTPAEPADLYVFHHLPNCTGPRFKQFLGSVFNLRPDYSGVNHQSESEKFATYRTLPLDLTRFSEQDCLVGHYNIPGIFLHERYPNLGNIPHRKFSVLRDPWEAARDGIREQMSRGWLAPDMPEDDLSERLLQRARYFSLVLGIRDPSEIDSLFDRYWFIAPLDRINDVARIISIQTRSNVEIPDCLDQSPQTGPPPQAGGQKFPDWTEDRFRETATLDYAIYHRAQQTFAQLAKAHLP